MIDRVRDVESNFGDQTEELRARALEYASVARERLADGSERIRNSCVQGTRASLGRRAWGWGSSSDG